MPNITRVEETDSGVEVEYEIEIMDEDTCDLIPAVMTLKCTFEGVIIDISDPEGEIIRTGYQLVDDLIEKTH